MTKRSTASESKPKGKNRTINPPILESSLKIYAPSISSPEVFSKSSLLMQTVVEKEDKADEGEIIIAVTSVWYEIIKLIEKDPDLIYQIKARKLEEIIAGLHERTGLFDEVILTPRSGDHGRDVILIKHGQYALNFFDQVKAYAPNRVVKASEIRESIGALSGDNTLKAIVTTTSKFAPRIMEDPAIKALHPYRLELRDGETLRKMLIEYTKKK